MARINYFFIPTLLITLYSIFKSPRVEKIDFGLFYISLLIIGTFSICLAIGVQNALQFYNRAKKEGRLRAEFDRKTPASAEEEFFTLMNGIIIQYIVILILVNFWFWL